MRKKRIIILGLLFVLACATAAAAHGGRFGIRGSLTDILELSETQQTELEALRTTFGEQKQALKEEHQAAFEAVLTEDQLAALEELKADRSGRRYKRHVSLSEELGLSEEQVEGLEAVRATFKEQFQAIAEEYQAAFEAVLTEDQLAALEEAKASRGRWCRKGDHADDDGATDAGDAEAGADDGDTDVSEVTLQIAPAASAATAVQETSWGNVKRALTN